MANVKKPYLSCSIFEDNCAESPLQNNFYHKAQYDIPGLTDLAPHPTTDDDLPILLTSNNTSFVNTMSNIAMLNNGLYLGAHAGYNPRLNATDYLFIQNPQMHSYGDSMHVLNVPVNLVDNNDPGGKIYMGYRFNDNFSLEERYTRFALGDVHTMTEFEYDNYMRMPRNNSYEVVARQSFPVRSGFNLLAKEAQALISTDIIRSPDGSSQSLVNDGNEYNHKMIRSVVGVGSGFVFSEALTADLYYTYLLNTPVIHAQLLSLGLTYRAD